jgi:hypothetical protein
MDTIEAMSNYVKATESADLAILAGVMASTLAASGMYMNHAAKKAEKKLTSSRSVYFEKHNIEPQRQAAYDKEICNAARADLEKLIRTFIGNPKSKPVLENIRNAITKEVKSFINCEDYRDEDWKDDFEPNKLAIKFGIFNSGGGAGWYEMIDVKYTGKGFIPDDNLWETGSMECHDVMKGFADALKEKYAEEIACQFVSIKLDGNYGVIDIH